MKCTCKTSPKFTIAPWLNVLIKYKQKETPKRKKDVKLTLDMESLHLHAIVGVLTSSHQNSFIQTCELQEP